MRLLSTREIVGSHHSGGFSHLTSLHKVVRGLSVYSFANARRGDRLSKAWTSSKSTKISFVIPARVVFYGAPIFSSRIPYKHTMASPARLEPDPLQAFKSTPNMGLEPAIFGLMKWRVAGWAGVGHTLQAEPTTICQSEVAHTQSLHTKLGAGEASAMVQRRITSLLIQKPMQVYSSTPCETPARNRPTRSPTPCQLGQGGNAHAQRLSTQNSRHRHMCLYGSCGQQGEPTAGRATV